MAINFNQRHLEVNKQTVAGLTRVYGHLRRAQASYWKAVGNPFLLSEEVAKRFTDIEVNLAAVQRSLDAAQIVLAQENAVYIERLNSEFIDKLA